MAIHVDQLFMLVLPIILNFHLLPHGVQPSQTSENDDRKQKKWFLIETEDIQKSQGLPWIE
jgi:hypothetical protein